MKAGEPSMKQIRDLASRHGKARAYVLFWLLGAPLPLLVVIFLLRGCN